MHVKHLKATCVILNTWNKRARVCVHPDRIKPDLCLRRRHCLFVYERTVCGLTHKQAAWRSVWSGALWEQDARDEMTQSDHFLSPGLLIVSSCVRIPTMSRYRVHRVLTCWSWTPGALCRPDGEPEHWSVCRWCCARHTLTGSYLFTDFHFLSCLVVTSHEIWTNPVWSN